MAEIRHRVGVAAPIDEVYEACTTRAGVARWWTEDVRGDGDLIEVHFGSTDPAATFEVKEAAAPTRVVWRTVQGPTEWIDTTVSFDLRRQGEETIVVFTQAGWAEPVEFMHHCSTRWGYFLMSLKHALEGNEANPWPRDEKASTWG